MNNYLIGVPLRADTVMTVSSKTERRPVIGLCGKSGSGKTTVCESFEKLGIMPIDTDKVYRELTLPDGDGKPSSLVRAIACEFGDGVVRDDGALDRPALAEKVFGAGNEENLEKLNTTVHKHILGRTREIIDEYFSAGARGVIVDAPALYESGFDKECDAVVCVVASEDERVKRIVSRDGISEDVARKRISSQISDDELLEKADFVIYNHDSGCGDDANTIGDCVADIVRTILEKYCGDN